MAPLAEVHCSLITWASQFSSTTRNLVPRFRRGVRGRDWLRNSNGSSRCWLLFWKRSIQYIDAFILLLHVKMMKSSSCLRDLHRTYEKVRGSSATTEFLKKGGRLHHEDLEKRIEGINLMDRPLREE